MPSRFQRASVFGWTLRKPAHSRKRLDLLNLVANQFFYQLQFIWIDDVIMTVARLLDPSKSQPNLTLRHLAYQVSLAGDTALNGTLLRQLAVLDHLGKPFIRHRHKRIAHADLEHRLASSGSVHPALPAELVDRMLAEIATFMNLLSHYYEHGDILYSFIVSTRGADWLTFQLRKAIDWDRLQEAGKADFESLMSDEYHDKSLGDE